MAFRCQCGHDFPVGSDSESHCEFCGRRGPSHCTECGQWYEQLSHRYCGVRVCPNCNNHEGLAHCYCGWSASGGNGRAELEEAGEVLEGEPTYNVNGWVTGEDLNSNYSNE